MSIIVQIVKLVEEIESNTITLRFGNGSTVEVTVGRDEGVENLKAGAMYTAALVPFVEASSPDAVLTGPEIDDTTLVPVDHPLVIAPIDSSGSDPAAVEEVIPQPIQGQIEVIENPEVIADPTSAQPQEQSTGAAVVTPDPTAWASLAPTTSNGASLDSSPIETTTADTEDVLDPATPVATIDMNQN